VAAVWLFARSELRRRWRTIVALALLAGVGGGVALTALAGAIRTDRAVSEMVAYSRPDTGGFGYGDLSGGSLGTGSSIDLLPGERNVIRLPEVAAWFRLPSVPLSTARSGQASSGLSVLASPDAAFFHDVDRPAVLAGRLPTAADPLDAAVNELAASKLHLHVGSPLRVYAYSAAQIAASAGQGGAADTGAAPVGPEIDLRVVAVYRMPRDVSAVEPYAARQDVSYESQEELYLPPSFLPWLARRLNMPVQGFPNMNLISVHLRHGIADFPRFATDAVKVGGGKVFVGDPGNVVGTTTAAASASRGTRLEAISLLAFGLVAALITILLVGQAVSRQVALGAEDQAVLQSLGTNRRQLFGAALIPAGVVGILGATFAFAVAVAASPLMPIGLARQAEIHPGLDVDVPVLVGGAVILSVLIALWSVPAVWRLGRSSADSPGSRGFAAIGGMSRVLRSPAAGVGLLFGLRRGAGRWAVPVGSALLAAVAAVAALTASLTFGASLSHLVASPREQGWNWDVLLGNPSDFTDREAQYSRLLSQNPLVGSYSAVAIIAGAQQGNAYIGKVALGDLLAFDPLEGSALPVRVQGRAPQGLREIVLGTRTLAKLHKKVGDTVQMDVGPPVGKIDLRVVGAMIAPSIGDIFTNSLGDGGWISGSALRATLAQKAAAGGGGGNGGDSSGPPSTTFSLFAVRFAPGVSPDAALASLRRQFGPTVLRQLPPADVIDLSSVRQLPVILAGLIGLLGVGTIGHTLITSVRRRRRDLALLKTMGFVRRQVGATVAWQATSFVLFALVSGVPLGMAAGRWGWHAVASGINSSSPVVVPAVSLALIVPTALLAANLLAAGPGWVAARVAPAVVLREE
jgi:hypothetical protein